MASYLTMRERLLMTMVKSRDRASPNVPADERQVLLDDIDLLSRSVSLDVGPLRVAGDFPENPEIPDSAIRLFADPCVVENVQRPEMAPYRALCSLWSFETPPREILMMPDERPAVATRGLVCRIWVGHNGEDGRWAKAPLSFAWQLGPTDSDWLGCSWMDSRTGDPTVEQTHDTELVSRLAVQALWMTTLVHLKQAALVTSVGTTREHDRLCAMLPQFERKRIRIEPNAAVRRVLREANRPNGIEQRYHFRRGNWASFADLKVPTNLGAMRSLGPRTVWRPPTMAGNPAKGYIAHSYGLESEPE